MTALWRSYGHALVTIFFGSVVAWSLVLILLPQVTLFERALTQPKRQLDSSIAGQLARDASTCANILESYLTPSDTATDSGSEAPSASSMAVPSASSMAVPSPSSMAQESASTSRPFILQCDRADTHRLVVRPAGTKAYLDELYSLPTRNVSVDMALSRQIDVAREIEGIAEGLHASLLEREARSNLYTFGNFQALISPVLIPSSQEATRIAEQSFEKKLLRLTGLRFTENGDVHERIGLIILARTLVFALLATLLSLIVCYPVACKLAYATRREHVTWLFLGLIIPYAIVELMRIYAWTSIIDNQGLINTFLDAVGVIDLSQQGAIPFKRYAGTVFLVIVYTYVLFMVFPMVNVMSTLDRNQLEAARDLGSSWFRVHTRIIIPHAKPGIAFGCIATFMLAAGAFSVPRIISRGLQSEWFTQTIYNKFFESENSNVGAAYSLSYTIICFALVAIFMASMRTRISDLVKTR